MCCYEIISSRNVYYSYKRLHYKWIVNTRNWEKEVRELDKYLSIWKKGLIEKYTNIL